jgi:hypothetical protein
VIDVITFIVALSLAVMMWIAIQGNDLQSVIGYGLGLLLCLGVNHLVHRESRPMRRQDG